MSRHMVRSCIVALIALATLACAQAEDARVAEPLIPETPDGTVKALVRHLTEHDAGILWEALPPSYRADINELTSRFAAAVDAELYNRSMALARSAVEVLQNKQALILGSETVAGTGIDVQQLEQGTTRGLAAAHLLLTSEIATLEGLAGIDWKQFLDTTGAQLMGIIDAALEESDLPPDDPFAMLRELDAETVSITDDQAVVRISSGERPPEEVRMTRVEGRWIPTELAEDWDQRVAEAHARLDEMTPETVAEIKPQAMMGLAMAEGIVQQLGAIESSEDFDAAVGPMLEAVTGNLALIPQVPSEQPEEQAPEISE